MNTSTGSKGTFKLKANDLSKVRSYLSSLLISEKYTVNDSKLSDESATIVATKGNRLLHFAAEQMLAYIPISEFFGWAVRVQVTFHISRNKSDGSYKLFISCEPASNEISPIDEYFSRYEQQDIFEAVGEDEKCREAFQLFAGKIIRSPYAG